MSLVLVVGHAASRDAPALVLDDGDAKTIGRARDSDLVVHDTTVSRRHATVTVTHGRAELVVAESASPVLYRGEPARKVALSPGEHIVLGSTVLTLVAREDERDEPPEISREVSAEAEDVATAIEGLAAEVRGLAAIVRLVEVLEGVDAASIDGALGAWAARSGIAASASLVEKTQDELFTSRGKSITVIVPGQRVALRLETRRRIDDTLRGIALVAARVVAARLGDLRRRTAIEEDNRVLRVQSGMSAREFLGESKAAREVARIVPRLAASDATALLLGESGTGKTFVARLIHEASARRNEPLRVVNCAAIPEALVESELFGAEKGAFSGAVASRAGAFEAAGRGTLLLDEIGELPLMSQAKLLRALEDRKFERVGSNRSLPLEARVLAATNRDLAAMVKANTFRADLYYRVNVVTLRVPALRERGRDVVVLAERILADLAAGAGRRVTGFSAAALEALVAYDWPGNVRELRNAIEHALVLGDGPQIEARDLPEAPRTGEAPLASTVEINAMPLDLAKLEERAIAAALEATGGNRTKAAELLGINRVTLQKKLKARDA